MRPKASSDIGKQVDVLQKMLSRSMAERVAARTKQLGNEFAREVAYYAQTLPSARKSGPRATAEHLKPPNFRFKKPPPRGNTQPRPQFAFAGPTISGGFVPCFVGVAVPPYWTGDPLSPDITPAPPPDSAFILGYREAVPSDGLLSLMAATYANDSTAQVTNTYVSRVVWAMVSPNPFILSPSQGIRRVTLLPDVRVIGSTAISAGISGETPVGIAAAHLTISTFACTSFGEEADSYVVAADRFSTGQLDLGVRQIENREVPSVSISVAKTVPVMVYSAIVAELRVYVMGDTNKFVTANFSPSQSIFQPAGIIGVPSMLIRSC